MFIIDRKYEKLDKNTRDNLYRKLIEIQEETEEADPELNFLIIKLFHFLQFFGLHHTFWPLKSLAFIFLLHFESGVD